MAHVSNVENIMSDNKTGTDGSTEDFKDQLIKHPLSKFEYDLYHEEDDIDMPVVRVKRFSMPNKGEKWKIFENGKPVFIVEGTKLSNKEKEFLRTVDGVNFLIAQHKQGIKSFNTLKGEIKKKIKGA
jgi:hypothetical protein